MAKILVVEDDPMQLEHYSIYLKSKDGGSHDVHEAKSATRAMSLIKQNQYDLVLLDIMMAYAQEDRNNPEIDDAQVDNGRKMGLYVYEKSRELAQAPPIALVSVVDDLAVLSEFPEVVGYLGKYFALHELGDKVKTWLGQ